VPEGYRTRLIGVRPEFMTILPVDILRDAHEGEACMWLRRENRLPPNAHSIPNPVFLSFNLPPLSAVLRSIHRLCARHNTITCATEEFGHDLVASDESTRMLKKNHFVTIAYRRAIILALTACFLLAPGRQEKTQAQTTQQLTPRVEYIRYADRFALGSSTGGIQEAINDFGAAPSCGIVYLPFGNTLISSTINLATRQGCTLEGHGTGDTLAGSPTSLSWTGHAGLPMLHIEGMGNRLENVHFFGNTSANPRAAIELDATKINASRNLFLNIGIGFWGPRQFTNGVLLSGKANGDTNTFKDISISSAGVGVDNENPNASDLHFDTLEVANCGVGFSNAAAYVYGTNWLFLNSGVSDLQFNTTGANFYVWGFVSEGSARMLIAAGSGQNFLHIVGGSWQPSREMAADGKFIDVSKGQSEGVHLEQFRLQPGPVGGQLPTINMGFQSVLRLIDTVHIFPANIVINPITYPTQNNYVVFQPEVLGGQNPMPQQQMSFDYSHAGDRGWQTWRNDFSGKVNVYGGEFRVDRLESPVNLRAIPTGNGSTTYSYKVYANTYGGHTEATGPVTTMNAASLGSSNYNSVTWAPVNGAQSYTVCGRTSGREYPLVTLTWDQIQTYGNVSGSKILRSPPGWIDDGSAAFSGTCPSTNTTGNGTFEGQLVSTVPTGTAPLIIDSTTPVPRLAATPVTFDASGAQQTNIHLIKDTCTLGTNCSVKLKGPAAFSSNASYDCWARDATAPTKAVTVLRTSGSAVAFVGSGTDEIGFLCAGD